MRSRAALLGAVAVVAGLLAGPASTATADTGAGGYGARRTAHAGHPSGATTAAAETCTQPDGTTPALCPTIVSVKVGNRWVRASTSSSMRIPITVVVDDPAGIATAVDSYVGRNLDQADYTSWLVVGMGRRQGATSGTGTTKSFSFEMESPYLPYRYTNPDGSPGPQRPAAFGGFQINPVVWGHAADDPWNEDSQYLTQTYRSGSILASSTVTNTPSATTVSKGGQFSVRGVLRRFDGVGQPGQTVNVYYVPAGQTRSSYAGHATTASNGSFSLPVRAYYTGSWFVSYPGSAFTTSTYKGAWVRVS